MEIMRAISILINTLLGGKSSETLCGRMYRAEACGSIPAHYVRRTLDAIFFIHHNHCEGSHRGDIRRAQGVTPFINVTGGIRNDRR